MGVDVPLQGQFLSPKIALFYTSREEVSTFPCRGSFCHRKLQGAVFGGFIRLIIRLAGLIGLARVPDIRFGVRVRA